LQKVGTSQSSETTAYTRQRNRRATTCCRCCVDRANYGVLIVAFVLPNATGPGVKDHKATGRRYDNDVSKCLPQTVRKHQRIACLSDEHANTTHPSLPIFPFAAIAPSTIWATMMIMTMALKSIEQCHLVIVALQ